MTRVSESCVRAQVLLCVKDLDESMVCQFLSFWVDVLTYVIYIVQDLIMISFWAYKPMAHHKGEKSWLTFRECCWLLRIQDP